MKQKITVNRECVIGSVEREVWGSFIEMMGRAVYGGIYDPSHPTADEEGFRGDVLDAVKELRVPIIRYPGGNMLSGYDWKDGIGKDRPVRLELAWGATEPNTVGLHEFASWARKAGSEVMMCVNMGTGSPRDAAQLVEYCNHPAGTYWSDLRRKNGAEKPFGVRKWCVGNEMDGCWQICGCTADEYGRKVAETAKLMRYVDKNIQLVVCGSADRSSFPVWDRKVLEHAYEYCDYISVHSYHSYTPNGQIFDFLSSHRALDDLLHGFKVTCDYVQALKRTRKTMMISVDEWNIWHTAPRGVCKNTYNDSDEDRWAVAPRRVENVYDFADALAFAGLACTIINHADRVKMGCLAQLVNVIAPILTNGETLVKQSIYFPYLLAIKYARGEALALRIQTPVRETENGDAGELYGACCKEGRGYSLFVLNKTDRDQPCALEFETGKVRMTERLELCEPLRAFNDFSHPHDISVRSRPVSAGSGASGTVPCGAAGRSCGSDDLGDLCGSDNLGDLRSADGIAGGEASFDVLLPAYSFTLFRFEE